MGALGLGKITPPGGIKISFWVDGKICFHRHLVHRDLVELGVYRIETVSDIREPDGPILMEKGLKSKGQNFIGAVAHKHFFRR